jgi:hypothetical protein
MDAYQEMIHTLKGCDVEEPLSVAALKANLHYAERLRMNAFEAHKEAMKNAHIAETALNNALTRKYYGQAKKDS